MEEITEGAFYRLPKIVRSKCRDLGKSHLDVYVSLMECEEVCGLMGKIGEWFECTIHMITQRSTSERTTVINCIEDMEQAGIIKVRRTKGRKNSKGQVRNLPNKYLLLYVGLRSPNNEPPTSQNKIVGSDGLNNKKKKKEKREKERKNPLVDVQIDSKFDTSKIREAMERYLNFRNEKYPPDLTTSQIEGQFAEFRQKQLNASEVFEAIEFSFVRGYKGISYPSKLSSYGKETEKDRDYSDPFG
jgi:hypothetical protein